MRSFQRRVFLPVTVVLLLLGTGLMGAPLDARAQAPHDMHAADDSSAHSRDLPLEAPGQSIFGTVQEAIRTLEADSSTDWSEVNVAALHQHLKDMQRVALDVDVEAQDPIDDGVQLRVRPENEAARSSLERVLDAHPHMLKQEAGWTMDVQEDSGAYVLRTTTEDGADVEKIRALGYMGLLAYGQHHQRHHWHLVRGQQPHE
ncbi:MAG: hypothetical protein ACLFTE_05925 [Salinivenus sp.]